MRPPLQVIWETTELNLPSSATSDVASFVVQVLTDQPGAGLASTCAIGWSVGIWTVTSVVQPWPHRSGSGR